jgi:acyl carrier protein
MSKRDPVIARIMKLLRESLFVEPPDADTDIVETGLIDSAGFMDLFIVLEDQFGIRIAAADLDLNHFRTVGKMAAFVIDKQNERPDR